MSIDRPAIVTRPFLAPPLLPSTLIDTCVVPCPDPAPSAIHDTEDDAVHVHDVLVVTLALKAPPLVDTDCEDGVTVNEHPA